MSDSRVTPVQGRSAETPLAGRPGSGAPSPTSVSALLVARFGPLAVDGASAARTLPHPASHTRGRWGRVAQQRHRRRQADVFL